MGAREAVSLILVGLVVAAAWGNCGGYFCRFRWYRRRFVGGCWAEYQGRWYAVDAAGYLVGTDFIHVAECGQKIEYWP